MDARIEEPVAFDLMGEDVWCVRVCILRQLHSCPLFFISASSYLGEPFNFSLYRFPSFDHDHDGLMEVSLMIIMNFLLHCIPQTYCEASSGHF